MDTTKTMITTRIYTIILDMYHHHQQQQKQQQPGQAIQKQFWQQQKKSISQAHIKFLVWMLQKLFQRVTSDKTSNYSRNNLPYNKNNKN